MNKYYITLRKSIKVTETLKKQGFKEIDEQISNTEADEEFMVFINKRTKTFFLLDHKNLMKINRKNYNLILTELKEIKKWEQKS